MGVEFRLETWDLSGQIRHKFDANDHQVDSLMAFQAFKDQHVFSDRVSRVSFDLVDADLH